MTGARQRVVEQLTAPGGPFELRDETVLGVPMRTYAGGPRSLREVVLSAAQFGDRDYLVYEGERWTYAEHLRLVAGFAGHLRDGLGVGKGDRVAIAMRNYPEWVVAFWSCQVLGAVAVPLNAWWTGPELAYALQDSGARVVVADGERVERLLPELPGLPDLAGVVGVRCESDPPGVLRWEQLVASFDPAAAMPEAAVDPDDDATIMYTSGTTGRPKGAVATHRNHCTNLMNSALVGAVNAALKASEGGAPAPAPSAPAALQTMPLFHIGGLSGLYVNTAFGAKLVLMYRWDTAEALDLIEREHVTSAALVPTLLRRLLEAPDLAGRDLSALGGLVSGGAPVPPDLIGRIESGFARRVAPGNGYGLTETTSAIVVNSGDMYFAKPDSVGLPAPTAEIRIVGPDGVDCGPGEVGELWARGPNIVRGYWNKPEATAEAFTDGWFHSGDLGYVDDEGFVYVVDRLKDVVIRGGENVYCAEVEAVLFQHPDVFDVAVVGVPHPAYGEDVVAVVQPRQGADLGADDLRRFAAERLAAFKVPAHVVLRATPLPRNATGKVLKRQLRDEVAAAT